MEKIKSADEIKNAAKETIKKYRELIIQEAHKHARRNTTRKGN